MKDPKGDKVSFGDKRCRGANWNEAFRLWGRVKGVVGCFLKWWVFPQFTPQNDQF